jgi:hypothetical protein
MDRFLFGIAALFIVYVVMLSGTSRGSSITPQIGGGIGYTFDGGISWRK